ncbi:MAG: prepilin peptidase [Spirochaetales bacterium]|nr:prepilin peptidase [Spirochaetales bacterium]
MRFRYHPAVDGLILPGFLLVAIVSAVIDSRTFRIPDALTGGFALFALSLDLLDGGLGAERALAALLAGMILMLAGRVSGAGIGLGDVKLGAAGAYALGLVGGWVMLAVASGLGVSLALISRRRNGPKESGSSSAVRVPFAPFLAAGAIVAVPFACL